MLIFDSLTGLLAPHICLGCGAEGALLCSVCIDEYYETPIPRCIGCMRQQDNFNVCGACKNWLRLDSVYFCGIYEGVLEQLIKELKFNYKRQAVLPISEIMSDFLSKDLNDYTLLPVPTAPKRIRERGFDHTKLIATQISKKTNNKVEFSLKRKSNARQLGSTRKQRILQMKQEFYVKEEKLADNIILIDDVMTTGSTLAAAAETLHSAGVKNISAIIFARKI